MHHQAYLADAWVWTSFIGLRPTRTMKSRLGGRPHRPAVYALFEALALSKSLASPLVIASLLI